MHEGQGLDDASAGLLSGGGDLPGRGARRALAALGGVAVFACALASAFHPYLGSDLERVAPAVARAGAEAGDHPGGVLAALDHRFVAWLVARNAWTLLHRPLALFDAEPCYPERNSLTFGEPGIAFGLVGIPGWILTGDPIATYGLALPALAIVSGIAVFLLVRDWTGVPAAGLVAALLYAFHPVPRAEILHPYAWDAGWMALALFFAVRLCERQRWRDAIGLVAATAVQFGSSLYATLGAALASAPLLVWLLASQRLRAQRPLQWLAVVLSVGVAALAIYGPFLERHAEGALAPRSYQVFLAWRSLLPGGEYWPGLALLALAAAGVARSGSRFPAGGRTDPRWALLLGALLALLVATGGATDAAFGSAPGEVPTVLVPNLYAWLARFVPGLDVIRGVSRLYAGVLLALCVLAGLGAAALIRSAPGRLRAAAGVGLVLVGYVDTLRPASLGFRPRVEFRMTEIAPPPEQIDLFRCLAELGDAGPVAETPLHRSTHLRNHTAVLLSAYHHRRTSACHNSYLPPGLGEVDSWLARLPEPDAVARLRDLGFTTIVVHHASRTAHQAALRRRFEASAAGPDPPIVPLAANPSFSAYAIAR